MVLQKGTTENIRTILVIRFSSIGDIVLTTPVLRRLRAAYPEASIDFCIKSPFVSLVEGSPYLNAVYTSDAPPRGHYDLVVDLQNNLRSRSLVQSISYHQLYRYHKQNWKKLLLVRTGLNLFGTAESVVDRYMAAIEDRQIAGDDKGCELWFTEDDRNFAASVGSGNERRLAVCFGANHLTKRYPPGKFASVIESLLSELKLSVLLLGGTEDVEQADEILAALSVNAVSRVVNLAGKSSLTESAAVLESCDAVLTNDTGLMHMASAFGKQLFVLFGSSVGEFGFLPYHTSYCMFEVADLPCRPCSHIGKDHCPKGHFKCMMDIPEQAVAEKISDYFKNL